jgi:serine/threonine protein kinase
MYTKTFLQVDVYALGCILNEAYTRRQPWKDSNHFFQIILKVAINGERPWMDPDCPEPLKRLIVKCWHQDPHQRPSCADIMRRTDILIQEELMKWEKFNPTLGQEMRKVVSSRA